MQYAAYLRNETVLLRSGMYMTCEEVLHILLWEDIKMSKIGEQHTQKHVIYKNNVKHALF